MEWVYAAEPPPADPLRHALRAAYRGDEAEAVARILAAAELAPSVKGRIEAAARRLVVEARKRSETIARYVASLATREGVRFDLAALHRLQMFPETLYTRHMLGFGGAMPEAPTLAPLWDWVPYWGPAAPALP